MSAALNLFRSMFPDAEVTAAAPANHADPHPIRAYVDAVKRGLTRKPIPLGGGVSIFFRTVAALKKTPGEYLFKFTFEHNNDEIPDLELVLYCGLDDMIGLFQARKIRAVSSTQQYRHTMKDEAAVLSSDPKDVCTDLKHKLGVNGELNHLVLDLYKQAIRHLATRHPENDVEQVPVEELKPFDYAMEIRRVLHGKPIRVDNDTVVTFEESTALKADDDVVLKFKLELAELTKSVPDLELLMYVTTDSVGGMKSSIGIRKVRIRSKKEDYSDSETQHWFTLGTDPEEAAKELLEYLQNGLMNDVVHEMAHRAQYSLNGGLAEELEPGMNGPDVLDPEDRDGGTDEQGGGIDWAELGLEDPGV